MMCRGSSKLQERYLALSERNHIWDGISQTLSGIGAHLQTVRVGGMKRRTKGTRPMLIIYYYFYYLNSVTTQSIFVEDFVFL